MTTLDTLAGIETSNVDWLENRPYSEIRIGDTASLERRVTNRDIQLFAAVSGDVNPAHVDAVYAKSSRFHGIIAHGMLGASLISTLLGTRLPGIGTIYLGQSLKFLKPVHVGDVLTVIATVTSLDAARHRLLIDTRCINQDGETVISCEAEVMAPTEKQRVHRTEIAKPLWADKNLRYAQSCRRWRR